MAQTFEGEDGARPQAEPIRPAGAGAATGQESRPSPRTADAPAVGRASRSRLPWVVGGLVVVGGIVWAVRSHATTDEKKGQPAAPRPVSVLATPAQKRAFEVTLSGLGSVTALNTVTVRTRVDGPLTSVAFTEGKDVERGAPLAEIDPGTLPAQRDQAAAQKARDEALRDGAQTTLDTLVASEKASPAQLVEAAKAAVTQYEGTVQSDQGQIDRDKALLSNARTDLERYRSAGGAASAQQVTTAEAAVRQYEAAVRGDEGQIEKDRGLLANARAELTRALAAESAVPAQQVAAARATVAQYDAAVKNDQALIDSVSTQIEWCHVKAPIAGRIGFRLVDVGNIVHASDPDGIAVIAQVKPIAVVFTLPEEALRRVQAAQRAAGDRGVRVEALDRDLGRALAVGTLLTIDNRIDSTTGTFRLKASFANADESLFPNQFVNARILVETIPDAVVVPARALQRGPSSTYAFVVGADSTVAVRDVTPGPTEREETVVVKGLEAGESVVTEGTDRLQKGTHVTIRKEGGEPPKEGGRDATKRQ